MKQDQNSRHKDPMNPSERIDQLIAGLTDWRGKTFASIRKGILEADREIIEEWKWMGSPVWSHDGIIAVANAHKKKVKLTFSHGASLPDPEPDSARVKAGHDRWLVVIGICTHLGCIPLAHQGAYDGWFCPCHGSQYDTSGRIRQGPAPKNLALPPYKFVSDTKIQIG